MTTINLQEIKLEIDYDQFDGSKSIDLRDVAESGLVPGSSGSASLAALRRFVADGYFPFGKNGPALKFPVVRVGNRFRTMPEWVAAFAKEVKRLGTKR